MYSKLSNQIYTSSCNLSLLLLLLFIPVELHYRLDKKFTSDLSLPPTLSRAENVDGGSTNLHDSISIRAYSFAWFTRMVRWSMVS